VALGVALAYAYNQSSRTASPTGVYGNYGPNGVYGRYGNSGQHSSHGQWGGPMGGFGMGMMR